MKGKDETQLDVFVAAAHELKAPLVLLRHLAHSLDEDSDLSDFERRQNLQRLSFTTDRMMRLVQQLTLSYRLEQDGQSHFSFQLEPLSITEVCDQALHELTPYAKEYKQELRLRGRHCPHLVLANREILHDIVVNLVDNAIRHNQSGGVVDVTSFCKGEQVRLQVHDSGVGVLQSELAQLRHTIGRQAQPLSGRSGSSGLGLYIVGQLAEAMGGGLGLGRSENGATFFVDLLRSRQMSLL